MYFKENVYTPSIAENGWVQSTAFATLERPDADLNQVRPSKTRIEIAYTNFNGGDDAAEVILDYTDDGYNFTSIGMLDFAGDNLPANSARFFVLEKPVKQIRYRVRFLREADATLTLKFSGFYPVNVS